MRRASSARAGLCASLGMLALALTAMATNVEAQSVAEGRHIRIVGSQEEVEAVRAQLPFLDDAYEALADLVGAVPYDGAVIEIRSDPSHPGGAYAGNPIVASPDVFDELFWFIMTHELGHDFTLSVGWQGLGCPSAAWIEGWAQFVRQEVLRTVSPRHPELTRDDSGWMTYEGFRQFLLGYVADYERAGTYETMDPNAFAGILQALTDDHGWNATRQVLHSMAEPVRFINGTIEGECTRLVRLAEQGYAVSLRGRFVAWGFPLEEEDSRIAAAPVEVGPDPLRPGPSNEEAGQAAPPAPRGTPAAGGVLMGLVGGILAWGLRRRS